MMKHSDGKKYRVYDVKKPKIPILFDELKTLFGIKKNNVIFLDNKILILYDNVEIPLSEINDFDEELLKEVKKCLIYRYLFGLSTNLKNLVLRITKRGESECLSYFENKYTLEDGKVPPLLTYKEIHETCRKINPEFEEKIRKIINEIDSKEIILLNKFRERVSQFKFSQTQWG